MWLLLANNLVKKTIFKSENNNNNEITAFVYHHVASLEIFEEITDQKHR